MQYLPKTELAKLFRVMHASNTTHQLIALTCFFTGARISQVLQLQGQDIFEHDGKWVIKIHAAKRGAQALHTLHIEDDPAFDMRPLIAIAKTRPLARLFGGTSRQYMNLRLKDYCAAAGIHTDFGHSHVFRHSISMIIWDETQRLGAISQFLQHKSASSAMCYLAEVDGKLGQDAVDKLQLA
jgi:integrase